MTAEWVTAIAASLTALTAFIAVVYAARKYEAYKREIDEERERKIKENTIELLSKHESDPVLHEVQSYLNKARRENDNDLSKIKDKGELKFYSSRMLNYYEGIAYRVREGLVDKDAIREQYKPMIIRDVELIVENRESRGTRPPKEPLFAKDEITDGLQNLMKLYKEFKSE